MLKLLRIEWYILSKSKIFWIVISLSILSMFAFPFIMYSFRMDDAKSKFALIDAAFSFPIVFNTISVVELFPFQLISIYFISIICNEFEFDTYRLHIQAGISKFKLWQSKLSLSIFLCFAYTFLVFLVSIFFGFINEKELYFEINLNSFKWLLIFFIQSFAYLTFAMTISLIFKKAGLAIIIYIIWFGMFERISAQIINSWLHLSPFGNFLPGKSIEDLSYLQAFKGYFLHNSTNSGLGFLFAILWISLSVVTNAVLFRKTKY